MAQLLLILTRSRPLKNSRSVLPRNQSWRFLGVTGNYRRHIENYSQLVFPFTELTKKNKPDKFQMNGVELAAFDDLRKALITRFAAIKFESAIHCEG